MIYSSFGDLGDTLYCMTVMTQMGAGELVLYPAPGRCREPYSVEKVERVRGFFEQQSYVTSVRFAEKPQGTVLDKWRKSRDKRHLNLADRACSTFKLPPWERGKPWFSLDRTEHVADVLFHRTPRWNGDGSFPWCEAVERWRDRGAFIGTKEEHRSFCDQFGEVPHHSDTPDLISLARCVGGCRLLVCGQSTPRALAEGLARPVWVEQGEPKNTFFSRLNAFYDASDKERAIAHLEQDLLTEAKPEA